MRIILVIFFLFSNHIFSQDFKYKLEIISNGLETRYGSPYPALEYSTELISGSVNEDGLYSEGTELKLNITINPGWDRYIGGNPTHEDLAVINGEKNLIMDSNKSFIINVGAKLDTYPFDQKDENGDFLNVGPLMLPDSNWYTPGGDINFLVSDNYFLEGYVDAVIDRVYATAQLLDLYEMDYWIYDWESSPELNREMFKNVQVKHSEKAYKNQLIHDPIQGVELAMKRYDDLYKNNGWPFGSAGARVGFGKTVGEITKNNYIEYLESWAASGVRDNNGNYIGPISVDSLLNSEFYYDDWLYGVDHEYIHIWQVSQHSNGLFEHVGTWVEHHGLDPSYQDFVAPRWWIEGFAIVLPMMAKEKLNLRGPGGSSCCDWETIHQPFRVRNYLKRIISEDKEGNSNWSRLRFDETNINGYYDIGTVATFYILKKLNLDFDKLVKIEKDMGSFGWSESIKINLDLSLSQFYDQFNTWYHDSGYSVSELVDFLYPEGTDPIKIDLKRNGNRDNLPAKFNFVSLNNSIIEGDSIEMYVHIHNPKKSEIYNIDIVLDEENSTSVDNFKDTTITFQPGEYTSKKIKIKSSENSNLNDRKYLKFKLRNPSGQNVKIGNDSIFSLTINNNDSDVTLAINEILYSVPQDDPNTLKIEGDANKDGNRNEFEDQFIEIFNYGVEKINLRGLRIYNKSGLIHEFEMGSLESGKSILVFGGAYSEDQINSEKFNNSIINFSNQCNDDTCNTRYLKLDNNDEIILIDYFGNIIDYYSWSSEIINSSITRMPDITGEFIKHTDANDSIYSPGYLIDSNTLDLDQDGIHNLLDNCPLTANIDQLDTDGDGEGDVCDTDDDGDGVLDTDDNCPLTANADQLDTDGDGTGDVCEDPPLFTENVTFVENIYPNPTDDKLTVIVKPGLEIRNLYFVDFSGKTIKPKSVIRTQNNLDINVTNFSEGIYILEIVLDKEVDKVKVVIER